MGHRETGGFQGDAKKQKSFLLISEERLLNIGGGCCDGRCGVELDGVGHL